MAAPTLTSLFTFPVAIFAAGLHGPFVTPALPAGAFGYQLQFVKTAWPAGSADVAIFTIEESFDGGVTWQFGASATHTQNASPLATEVWNVTFGIVYDEAGNPTILKAPDSVSWKLRITVNALSACNAAVIVKSMS